VVYRFIRIEDAIALVVEQVGNHEELRAIPAARVPAGTEHDDLFEPLAA